MLLEHLVRRFLGMAEQDLVELLAQDLKRLRRRSFEGGREIGILLDRAVGSPEAGSPLLDEPGRRDRLADAERGRISLVHGSCDSPMWKRGNRSRSSTTTLRPRLTSSVAALDLPAPHRSPPHRSPTGSFTPSMVVLEHHAYTNSQPRARTKHFLPVGPGGDHAGGTCPRVGTGDGSSGPWRGRCGLPSARRRLRLRSRTSCGWPGARGHGQSPAWRESLS